MKVELIDFEIHGDERGLLIALEENKNIPFTIKRVYYIYDTKEGVVRGKHAHKKLNQIAVCVNGSCKFMLDDGKSRKDLVLDSPNKGLLIGDMIWHEMYDFSKDCVLMVLSEEYYDESDYIRDYNEFLEYLNANSRSK